MYGWEHRVRLSKHVVRLAGVHVAIAPKIAESAGIIVSSRKNQNDECASSSR